MTRKLSLRDFACLYSRADNLLQRDIPGIYLARVYGLFRETADAFENFDKMNGSAQLRFDYLASEIASVERLLDNN